MFKTYGYIILFLLCAHTVTGQFELLGDAVMIDENTYRLTKDELNENGSIWHKLRHDFTTDFSVAGKFYFGENDDGADGIVFVIQDNCIGTGGVGQGIGYEGFPGNSIAVEFDTWQNLGGTVNDPPYDHTAIVQNGSVNHNSNLAGPVQMNPSDTNVEDGNWYAYEINYDVSLQLLEVFFNGSERFSYTVDIVDAILNGDPFAYWGFTSATGGFSAANSLTIEDFEAFTISDYTLCSEEDEVIINMPYDDVDYTWFPTTGLTSVNDGQLVTLDPDETTLYTVVLPDICLGSVDVEFTVFVSDTEVTSAAFPTTCDNEDNGSASVDILTSQEPITILWSTGEETPEISNLTPGSYTVTVTDALDCEFIETVIVEDSDSFIPNETISHISCFGENDASILLDPQGGTEPYSYLWTTNATTASITDLMPGSYSVTILDIEGCENISTFIIEEPTELSADYQILDVVCFGEVSGAISISVSGGSGEYEYLWSHGVTTANAEGLAAGTYSITITDSNNCTTIGQSLVVAAPDSPLEVTFSDVGLLSCVEGDVTSVTALATGGAPPYDYVWSNGETGSIASNLSPGLQQVLVTDSNGCIVEDSLTLDIANPFIINTEVSNISCDESEQGIIFIETLTGTPPYLYSIDGGLSFQNENLFDNLPAGAYEVTVEDDEGCVQEITVEILAPLISAVDAGMEQVLLPGQSIESQATVIANSNEINIQWSPPDGVSDPSVLNPTFSPDTTTLYTLTISDSLGCSLTSQLLIRVEKENIFIPNIFSPQATDGNGLFRLYSDDKVVNILSMLIYDRWGNLIYKGSNLDPTLSIGWDGTFNGESVQSGVYVYVFDVELLGNRIKRLVGDVTLVR